MASDPGGGPEQGGPHAELIEEWVAALGSGARDHVVPMSRDEAIALLAWLARRIDTAARTGESAEMVAELGAELARAHFVGDEVLGRSISVLDAHFARADAIPAARAAELLGAFTTGYVRAFRQWLLAEQESVRAAEMTARLHMREQLRASEARFRAVFAQAGIGTGLSDMTGRIIEVNAAFAHMLGYSPAEMCALEVTDLDHPDDDPGMWPLYASVLRGDVENVQLEKAYPHRDGRTVWTNINVSLIRDDRGDPRYTLILVEDISERRALRERLHYRAHHDQLTGLANRTRFFDALTAAFTDPDSRIGLCYVDLDHFKVVNDTFGHAVGDELLVQAAARLNSCADGFGQLVARIGGDEFVVLVPNSTADVDDIARCVRRAFTHPFEVHGHRLTVTASVGIAEEYAAHTTADDLLQAADYSMYWAKAAGERRRTDTAAG
ncbi:diguanylate cyclase [Nocardia sp. SYP-A9097]|uniref:GGDEF domain-containing protein n=1 Tax=Nocardia sp. SYP-A9097 TaxID=2663237 RepID=UPI00129A6172|nr:GGDEF domain-containing protein [Nocardia sp. SYP-A9097]MRH90838.1 diguanylate cyclase [Nocardia sp. SYP-A9097]